MTITICVYVYDHAAMPQAVLLTTIKPQVVNNTALAAASVTRSTLVVPIDLSSCPLVPPAVPGSTISGTSDPSRPVPSPAPSPRGNNPAVQVLQVQFGPISARSVTQYTWSVRHSSKSEKESVKFSEKATLTQTVEVRTIQILLLVGLVRSLRCVQFLSQNKTFSSVTNKVTIDGFR